MVARCGMDFVWTYERGGDSPRGGGRGSPPTMDVPGTKDGVEHHERHARAPLTLLEGTGSIDKRTDAHGRKRRGRGTGQKGNPIQWNWHEQGRCARYLDKRKGNTSSKWVPDETRRSVAAEKPLPLHASTGLSMPRKGCQWPTTPAASARKHPAIAEGVRWRSKKGMHVFQGAARQG